MGLQEATPVADFADFPAQSATEVAVCNRKLIGSGTAERSRSVLPEVSWPSAVGDQLLPCRGRKCRRGRLCVLRFRLLFLAQTSSAHQHCQQEAHHREAQKHPQTDPLPDDPVVPFADTCRNNSPLVAFSSQNFSPTEMYWIGAPRAGWRRMAVMMPKMAAPAISPDAMRTPWSCRGFPHLLLRAAGLAHDVGDEAAGQHGHVDGDRDIDAQRKGQHRHAGHIEHDGHEAAEAVEQPRLIGRILEESPGSPPRSCWPGERAGPSCWRPFRRLRGRAPGNGSRNPSAESQRPPPETPG